jgi:hypothetical protein
VLTWLSPILLVGRAISSTATGAAGFSDVWRGTLAFKKIRRLKGLRVLRISKRAGACRNYSPVTFG